MKWKEERRENEKRKNKMKKNQVIIWNKEVREKRRNEAIN